MSADELCVVYNKVVTFMHMYTYTYVWLLVVTVDNRCETMNKGDACLPYLVTLNTYIPSTYFHREYPWIINSSDDQTIRMWK